MSFRDGNFVFRVVGVDVTCEYTPSSAPPAQASPHRYHCLQCGLQVEVVSGHSRPWCCSEAMHPDEARVVVATAGK